MKNDHGLDPEQTDASIAKNISFFGKHRDEYDKNVQELDTYKAIRGSLNEALRGIDRLLDIGNGGVFDYDTSIVRNIVALDLFLDDLPSDTFPANVMSRTGSALDIPEPDESFDGVLLSMLIHHLVGKTVEESLSNVRCAVREAFRVLRPGGRLIILESCVPPWFYLFERTMFPLASWLINVILSHPATLQYPALPVIAKIVGEYSPSVEMMLIPKGRWIIQYGFKFPSVLTPAQPFRFISHKRNPYQAAQ